MNHFDYFEDEAEDVEYSQSQLRKSNARNEGASDSDEHGTTEEGFLWSGFKHRPGTHGVPKAHLDVLEKTKRYLIAENVGGHAGPGSTAWPDRDERWLNDQMKKAWLKMGKPQGRVMGQLDSGVQKEPGGQEARILCDAVRYWRSHCLSEVRRIVNSTYSLGKEYRKTPEATRTLARHLLDEDRFACSKREENPPSGRFAAEIISTALQGLFFSSRHMALGSQKYTKEFFRPLRATPLVFVCVCIERAIREYDNSAGEKKNTKFGGAWVDAAVKRLGRTFEKQSQARKERLFNIHLKRIKKQLDMTTMKAEGNIERIYDRFADRVDDLQCSTGPEDSNGPVNEGNGTQDATDQQLHASRANEISAHVDCWRHGIMPGSPTEYLASYQPSLHLSPLGPLRSRWLLFNTITRLPLIAHPFCCDFEAMQR